MKGATTSEADLARVAVTELQRMGYETYEEVAPFGGGGHRADIVGVLGSVICIVEVKRSMSLRFLDQLLGWQSSANRIIGACARGRCGVSVTRLMRAEGIGLWRIEEEGYIREDISPRLDRSCSRWHRKGLLDACRDENRTGSDYAKAGANGGGYWTPFGATRRELIRVVRAEPGLLLREVIERVDHHYASNKSAIGSLSRLMMDGASEEVEARRDGRALRVYPAEVAP